MIKFYFWHQRIDRDSFLLKNQVSAAKDQASRGISLQHSWEAAVFNLHSRSSELRIRESILLGGERETVLYFENLMLDLNKTAAQEVKLVWKKGHHKLKKSS